MEAALDTLVRVRGQVVAEVIEPDLGVGAFAASSIRVGAKMTSIPVERFAKPLAGKGRVDVVDCQRIAAVPKARLTTVLTMAGFEEHAEMLSAALQETAAKRTTNGAAASLGELIKAYRIMHNVDEKTMAASCR